MQRGVRFDMCPFGTGARYMGSKKRSKQFKINGLGCFREAFFGGPIWTIQIAKAFPCSVALVFFRRSAPMQRGAHFVIFDVPCGAPCWAQRGHQKRYEIYVCFNDFPNEGHAGSGHQMHPEDQN